MKRKPTLVTRTIVDLCGTGSELHHMWLSMQPEAIERARQHRLKVEALWALAQVLCDLLGEPAEKDATE